MPRTTAKLFMHGRSQAVRLPKEFRMPGTEVEIMQRGGIVALAPRGTTKADWDRFWREYDALGPTDDRLVDRQSVLTPPPGFAES